MGCHAVEGVTCLLFDIWAAMLPRRTRPPIPRSFLQAGRQRCRRRAQVWAQAQVQAQLVTTLLVGVVACLHCREPAGHSSRSHQATSGQRYGHLGGICDQGLCCRFTSTMSLDARFDFSNLTVEARLPLVTWGWHAAALPLSHPTFFPRATCCLWVRFGKATVH